MKEIEFDSPIPEHLGNMFVQSMGMYPFQDDVVIALGERKPMVCPIETGRNQPELNSIFLNISFGNVTILLDLLSQQC